MNTNTKQEDVKGTGYFQAIDPYPAPAPNNLESELSEKLINALAKTTHGFHSSQLEAISPIINSEVTAVLVELEKKKATYQDCDTGEHKWSECTCDTEDAIPLEAIQSIKEKYQ